MKNRRHENRLASTMQATGENPTREQPAIRLLHCDFDLGIVQNSEFFGALTPQIAGHRVLVEHFSGRPRRGHPSRTIAKAAVFAFGPTDGERLAMVVLCTNGIGAFKRLLLNPHPTEPGWSATTIGLTTMHVPTRPDCGAMAVGVCSASRWVHRRNPTTLELPSCSATRAPLPLRKSSYWSLR